jgi:hypothetical protein
MKNLSTLPNAPLVTVTFHLYIVQANPTVRAVWSAKALLASRTGAALRVPRSAWSIQVMPPDGPDEMRTPQFGP